MEPPNHPENKPAPPRPNIVRALVALFAVVLIGLGLTMIFVSAGRPVAKKAKSVPPASHPSSPSLPSSHSSGSSFLSPLADELNFPRITIQRDLQILNGVLLAWQTHFRGQGNPVGEN